MNKSIKYINRVLGTNFYFKPVPSRVSNLPLFLTQSYDFSKGELFSKTFYFLHQNTEKKFSPDQYLKHAELVHQATNYPVIFVFDHLESFNRNRLIEKRVNFIVPERQLYLPSLLIDLNERDLKPKVKRSMLPSAAQCLLLYHLQIESLQNKTFNELEELLPYTYLTITRAAKDLCSFSLCTLSSEKQKRFSFDESKPLLWEKALPYLSNPIKNRYYVDTSPQNDFTKIAGISALARYSMLNDESMVTYAIGTPQFQTMRNKQQFDVLHAHEGMYCIQVWKYDPAVLSRTNCVDPLSLFLTFRDTKDERIEIAVRQMVEGVRW